MNCCKILVVIYFKDAVQSDLRMCTKEPSFYLQTVYLGFYFILCSCKAWFCKYERSVGILLINVSLPLILLISPLKVTQQLQQYELSRHKGI
jgi:hypothetical protein